MDRYTANRYIWLKDQIASGGSVPQELLDEVAALDATVNGDETSEPPVVGLVDVVGDLEEIVEDLDIDINGDDTTEPPTPGLKDRVTELETTINGDSSVSPVIPPLLAGAGNVRLTSLWTNADPSQAFTAGDITLSSSDYNMLLVLYNYATSGGAMSLVAPKGSSIKLLSGTGGSSSGAMTATRDITYSTETLLVASDGVMAVGNTAGATNNNYSIPTAIYGIKIMSN